MGPNPPTWPQRRHTLTRLQMKSSGIFQHCREHDCSRSFLNHFHAFLLDAMIETWHKPHTKHLVLHILHQIFIAMLEVFFLNLHFMYIWLYFTTFTRPVTTDQPEVISLFSSVREFSREIKKKEEMFQPKYILVLQKCPESSCKITGN